MKYVMKSLNNRLRGYYLNKREIKAKKLLLNIYERQIIYENI